MHRGETELQLCHLLTSALGGDGLSKPRPGRFTPERIPGTHGIEALIGLQNRSGWIWRSENLLPTPGFEPRTVQPVANRYTDYATPPPPKEIYDPPRRMNKIEIISVPFICPVSLILRFSLNIFHASSLRLLERTPSRLRHGPPRNRGWI